MIRNFALLGFVVNPNPKQRSDSPSLHSLFWPWFAATRLVLCDIMAYASGRGEGNPGSSLPLSSNSSLENLTIPTSTLKIGSEDIPIRLEVKKAIRSSATDPNLEKGNHHPPKAHKSCIPCSAERPCLNLPIERINAKAQKMKCHVLIGKFMGF